MFRCRDLLALPTMTRAKLIAGECGLDREIRWSYKAEGMDFADWVHGRELLIVSSPVIHSADFDMKHLVEEAIRRNLSGILLLVGNEYVRSITSDIIKLANGNGLPVIGIPGEIPLVDIMEEVGHAISYQDRKETRGTDILAGIVFGSNIDEKLLRSQANLIEYPLSGPQRIFIAHLTCQDHMVLAEESGRIQYMLENVFRNHNCSIVLSRFNNNIIGMTGETSVEKLQQVLDTFLDQLSQSDSEINVRFGIGSACDQISKLGNSFTEASRCLSVMEQKKKEKNGNDVQWYEKLGFIRVLMAMENQELLKSYEQQILGKLIAYDKENKTQLVETLQAYFTCNENMKDTALFLYSHPNTIKYRLRRIEDITGFDLSSNADKLELQNALLIYENR